MGKKGGREANGNERGRGDGKRERGALKKKEETEQQ